MHKVEFGDAMVGGEPLELNVQDHKTALWTLGCCDCGLYHLFAVTRHGSKIIFRAYRDQFVTDLARARKRKRGKK